MKRQETAPVHGTISSYVNHRCSCEACRRAWADYHYVRRNSQRLADDDRRHGTMHGYINFRCRCAPCTGAMREYQQAKRQLYRDARAVIAAYIEEAAAATALAAKATPEANERYITAMRNRRRLVSGWEAGNR